MTGKFTFILLLIVSLFSACELINPEEDIPVTVKIDKVKFEAGIGHGSDSVDIKDVWFYVDAKPIGAYQLPAEFPVLENGKHHVEIRFGVILNGIAATRTINPFFTYDNYDLDFVPGDSILLKPESTYSNQAKFVWNSLGQEGFEEGGISIDSVPGSSTKITKTTAEVYEGTYSGQIHLDKDHTKYIGQSSKKFDDLPKGGQPVVLEINCKNTNNHFAIGMFVEEAGGNITIVTHLVVNPGPDWKKMYVNFTEIVSQYANAKSFRVFFTSELESQNTEADIYLDNIKLMHF